MKLTKVTPEESSKTVVASLCIVSIWWNDTNLSTVSMKKICLALYLLKEDISKTEKNTFAHSIDKIEVTCRSFPYTEIEVGSAVIASAYQGKLFKTWQFDVLGLLVPLVQ